MIKLPSFNRRRAIVAALAAIPVAVAGITRNGHTQEVKGGLWRGSDGGLYCGGTCGTNQVCCTYTINQT
jgi:hypothetical protein